MQLTSGNSTIASSSSSLDAAADALLQRGDALPRTAAVAPSKPEKAGRDFEALLLGQWLQQAEDTFARLPGTEEENQDPGAGTLNGVAMQSLGQSMAASGGIGIAKMIGAQLTRAPARISQSPGVTPQSVTKG